MRCRISDDAAANTVRGTGNIEKDLRQRAHSSAAGDLGKFPGEVIGLRNVSRDLLSAADQEFSERPEPWPAPIHLDLTVQRLHAKQNDRLSRPPRRPSHAPGPDRMPQQ